MNPRKEKQQTRNILLIIWIYRVATSMTPLAMLVTVSENISLVTASYSLAIWTLMGAISQPFWIAILNRLGNHVPLLFLGLTSAVFHGSVGYGTNSTQVLLFSGIAGGTLAPLTAHSRALLASFLESGSLSRAYDTEAALGSSAFVIAPIVVAASSAIYLLEPLWVVALLLAYSSLHYLHILPLNPVSLHSAGSSRDVGATAMGRPTWVLLVSGCFAYGALAIVEVATVARISNPTNAALALACWATSSLLAGLFLSRCRTPDQYRKFLLPVLAISCAAMGMLDEEATMAFVALLVISGISVSPLLALITAEVARVTASFHQPIAFGWLQAGSWLGSAAATTIAGLMISNAQSLLLTLAGALAAISVLATLTVKNFSPPSPPNPINTTVRS